MTVLTWCGSHQRPISTPPYKWRGISNENDEVSMEKTLNGKGCMFLKRDESVNLWLQSKPKSTRPLLDLGAAFGVNTLHALRAGRNVIAIDEYYAHIMELRLRVSGAQQTAARAGVATGRLVDAVTARLPRRETLERGCASGALSSQMLVFLKKGEPLQLFRDVHAWLEPGGLLVVATDSAVGLDRAADIGFRLSNGRGYEEVWKFVEKASDQALVAEAPTMVFLDEESPLRQVLGESMYLLTTQEAAALCRLSGFDILRLEYFSPKKYPEPLSGTDECVLLVAQKPG